MESHGEIRLSPTHGSFDEVVAALKEILHPYLPYMNTDGQPDNSYLLNTFHILPNHQPLFFAGVQARKNYASFYLMPVYVFPDLLDGISENLRKRMQGKSCFNFKQVNPELLAELAVLTKAGFERYLAAGYVSKTDSSRPEGKEE